MKNITILGVTGSIGQQTVDVCLHHQDEFNVVAMSAGKNIVLLETTIQKINPQVVCVIDEKDCNYLQEKYPHIRFVFGSAGLDEIATIDQVDIVLNAIVGFAGLLPTIHAIESKKDIALANKETLVVAGHIITKLVKEHGVKVLPVDSEHSAIFQSLQGNEMNKIKRILLTASGGSFRDKTREELVGVSVKEALNHPNWSMGAKITIDSATLFNKGLEVMEAKWLFGVEYDQVQVVIQPQSVIHSMVQFEDGAIIAQLGTPDMKLPIQLALTYPDRRYLPGKRLDFAELGSISFFAPDFENFPGLALAYKVGKEGGNRPTIYNAANEFAVSRFLDHKFSYPGIIEAIEASLDHVGFVQNPNVDNILETEAAVYEFLQSALA